MFISNCVSAETHALVLSRRGRDLAARVLFATDSNPRIRRIQATPDDERRAREIIVRYDDKAFSLTDAISFAIMERLGISHAFTFDRHFAQFGVAVLGLEASPG